MTQEAAPVPRRRRTRLADVSVAAKLGIIVAVPSCIVVLLASMAGFAVAGQAGRASDLRTVTAAGVDASALVDRLQRERLAAAVLLTADATRVDAARADYAADAVMTEDAVGHFRASQARVAGDDPLRSAFARADAGLAALAATRSGAMATRLGAPASSFLLAYGQMVADLLALRTALAEREAPAQVAVASRSGARLAEAKEHLAMAQVAVVRALDGQPFTVAARQDFIGARAAYGDALRRFTAGANADWRQRLDSATAGAGMGATEALAEQVAAAPTGTPLRLDGGPARWAALSATHLSGLRAVEEVVDGAALRAATAAREAAVRILVIAIALALAVLAIAVAVIAVAARAVARASRSLPAAVDRTAPRVGISLMSVDLARRSLRLVDGLLEELDGAERDEADPERLAMLFRFDHLAAQMRHANERLLALAGIDAARARLQPVVLVDVLRAAQSQVEQYRRVEFGPVDDDVTIVPHAVDGIVHLVAELLDNATRYSPVDQPVVVDGRRTDGGAAIQVVNRGAGVAPDVLADLNRRLAAPSSPDPSVPQRSVPHPPVPHPTAQQSSAPQPPGPGPFRYGSADPRGTGMTVVGRLASRHGATVELRQDPEGGVVAEVWLPPGLLHRDHPVADRSTASYERVAARRIEEAPDVEAGATGELPRRTPLARLISGGGLGTPEHDDAVDPDEVRALLSTYQDALGRFDRAARPAGEPGPPPTGSEEGNLR